MASEVGVAYLSIIPSFRGGAASLQRQMGGDLVRTSRTLGDQSGREYGRRFSSSARGIIGAGLGTALAYGAARVARESITLEAAFSRTMNRVAAATRTPRREMEGLERLAINLGARTTFSANEASDAMLSLAKGGLTQAEIRAGALADTLTLAAAGDLELADAADVTVQAMGAFNIKGTETERVASALAGAANASAADVSDLRQSLASAGTEANAAGLTIEETTGVLAAFSNAGIQGSDAGTSLRTMLSRLAPQTDKAQTAMKDLGLKFTDANGEFVSITEVAEQLQNRLGDLSDEERSTALATIFGSDARRAANILTEEGAEGLRKYIKATSDLEAAEKMAGAATRGTAGALERLDGATETAQLKIGRGLAPTVRRGANALSDFLDSAPLERWARKFGEGAEDVARELKPLGKDLLDLGKEAWPTFVESAKLSREVLRTMLPLVEGVVGAFNKLPDSVQQALILAVAARRLTGGGGIGGGLVAGAAAGAAAGGGAAAGAAGGLTAGAALRAAGRRAILPAIGVGLGMNAIDKWVDRNLDTDKIQDFTNNLSTLDSKMANFNDTLFGKLPGKTGVEEAREEIAVLDQRIAHLVRGGDLTKARIMFGRLAAEAHENGISMGTIRENMPRTIRAFNAGGKAADEMAQDIKAIPEDHVTQAAFKKDQAVRDVGAFKQTLTRTLGGIPDEKVNVELTGLARLAAQGSGPLLEGFASGGAIRGVGGPRQDNQLIRASVGEHVWSADEVRKVGGHGVVEAMRRMAKRGEIRKFGDLQPFADGGAVVAPGVSSYGFASALGSIERRFDAIADAIGERLSDKLNRAFRFGGGRPLGPGGSLSPGQILKGQAFARSQAGKPYIWGGVGPGGYDCSGFQSAVYNASVGRNPYQRLGSTATMPWPGMRPGTGGYTIGWFTGNPGHTSGNIGGLGVESRGGDGVVVGGGARSPLDELFNRIAHYDQGGPLKPGWTLAYNGTGRDEYVSRGGRGGRAQRIVLDAGGGRTLSGWIDDGVDANAEFAATTSRMRRN